MEKRILLVTVLSIGVLLGWSMFIAPMIAPPPPPAPAKDVEPPWTEVRQPEAPKPAPAEIKPPAGPPETLRLEGATIRAELTNAGGGLVRLESKFRDGWITLLEPTDKPHFLLTSKEYPALAQSLWEVKREGNTVTYRCPLGNGFAVERTWSLDDKQRHRLAMRTVVTNESGPPKPLKMDLQAAHGIPHDSDYQPERFAKGYYGITRRTRGVGATLTPYSLANVQEKVVVVHEKEVDPEYVIDAVGVGNRYFTVALLPESDAARAAVEGVSFHEVKTAGLSRIGSELSLRELSVTKSEALEWTVFAGPLEDDLLEEVKHGLSALHDYGSGCFLFGWIVRYIAPLLLFVMRMWNSVFGNWGVAILLTTVTLRFFVFPLSRKAQVSMAKMGELGPKIQLIRERHPDNPQKAQSEMMKLWKEHGVSPISGCLPMLLQLPIWISMYSVVDMAIELRQAPFMLWIHDLSKPDQLVEFGKTYSLLVFSMSSINVLPVIMTITWFLQAYFAPRSPDPQMQMQQKMMLIMPVVFGLMCYGLASGLSLYFFMNSLLSMAEQKIIKKIWIEPLKRKQGDAQSGART